jgi:thioredoxin 1
MSEPFVTSDESFERDVLDSAEPVLVDFWAEWCAPCKMIGPLVAEIAEEYDGQIKVAKLDADENPNTMPAGEAAPAPELTLPAAPTSTCRRSQPSGGVSYRQP